MSGSLWRRRTVLGALGADGAALAAPAAGTAPAAGSALAGPESSGDDLHLVQQGEAARTSGS